MQIRTEILLVLIWVQTVCKSHQKTAKIPLQVSVWFQRFRCTNMWAGFEIQRSQDTDLKKKYFFLETAFSSSWKGINPYPAKSLLCMFMNISQPAQLHVSNNFYGITDNMVNNRDPDQMVIWSWSTLFSKLDITSFSKIRVKWAVSKNVAFWHE